MRRSTEALEAERRELESRISELRSSGEVLVGVRLEKSAAAGTASRKSQVDYKYGRLRAGRGKVLENGLKSRYIRLEEIPSTEAAIERGRELERLQRRLTKLNEILG